MATTGYFPSRESDLVTWSNNFDTLVSADPAAYGLDLGQAAAFTVLNSAWVLAYTAANQDSTRTPAAIVAKNDAKDAMMVNARQLVAIVQADPGVTNVQRADLQITIRDTEPTPVPVPSAAPAIDILSSYAQTITVRLHDPLNPTKRGKPDGVADATVFSFVGAVPPADIADWKFEGNFGHTEIDIEFPVTVAPATMVWFTAYWSNPRNESGPATTPPVQAFLAAGLAAAA